jgi:hypothetical protein
MRIASISDNDSVNSITGFTLSIFTQSCPHHCKGCFSQQTWSDSGGKEYKIDEIKELINNSKCHNISFLGGDPLAPLNRIEIIELIKWSKQNTNKFIYFWTGYLKEEVEQWINLELIDILIDGKFELDKRNLNLLLRGSSNQRLFYKGKQVREEELLEIVDKI